MSDSKQITHARKQAKKGVYSRFKADNSGATAVEFGMVATPFFMLLFGILCVAIYFFTLFTLEVAVEVGSRQIRTRENLSTAAFKTNVCSMVPNYVQCAAKLQISVQEFADSAAITPASTHKCLDNSGNVNPVTPFDPGSAANPIVLVIACYEWELANLIPFLKLGNMGNGSMLIQAATTFRIEPP